jgi:hypothetical protein
MGTGWAGNLSLQRRRGEVEGPGLASYQSGSGPTCTWPSTPLRAKGLRDLANMEANGAQSAGGNGSSATVQLLRPYCIPVSISLSTAIGRRIGRFGAACERGGWMGKSPGNTAGSSSSSGSAGDSSRSPFCDYNRACRQERRKRRVVRDISSVFHSRGGSHFCPVFDPTAVIVRKECPKLLYL